MYYTFRPMQKKSHQYLLVLSILIQTRALRHFVTAGKNLYIPATEVKK
jgi:hypothetical protein